MTTQLSLNDPFAKYMLGDLRNVVKLYKVTYEGGFHLLVIRTTEHGFRVTVTMSNEGEPTYCSRAEYLPTLLGAIKSAFQQSEDRRKA
jgi:hypothetical protein